MSAKVKIIVGETPMRGYHVIVLDELKRPIEDSNCNSITDARNTVEFLKSKYESRGFIVELNK